MFSSIKNKTQTIPFTNSQQRPWLYLMRPMLTKVQPQMAISQDSKTSLEQTEVLGLTLANTFIQTTKKNIQFCHSPHRAFRTLLNKLVSLVLFLLVFLPRPFKTQTCLRLLNPWVSVTCPSGHFTWARYSLCVIIWRVCTCLSYTV